MTQDDSKPSDGRDIARWSDTAIVAGISLVPGVGGPLSVAVDALLERRRGRVAELGAALLEHHTPDELLARLRDDERFGEMFVRAAETTARSWWAEKRSAMGRVVSAVLDGDEATVDESEHLLFALERLDASHFAALARLRDRAVGLGPNMAGVDAADVPGLTPGVLAALVAVGAVGQQSGWDGIFYRATELGDRLLALVTV